MRRPGTLRPVHMDQDGNATAVSIIAAIRWGPRGTVATASVVIVTYLLMTVSMSRTLGPVQDELNRIIIRMMYLVVAAGMLVYLGRYEARLRSGIESLARWPVPAGKSSE